MRWLSRGVPRAIGLLAVAGAAFALPAPALAQTATVSGIVFNDWGMHGVQNVNPAAGPIDYGVGGVAVRAYNAKNQVVGQTTSASDGVYALTGLPPGPVRIEVETPWPYYPSVDPSSPGGTVAGASPVTTSTLDSDERYFNDSSSPSGVNFGLEIPGNYSTANPELFMGEQWFGPVDDPTAASNAAITKIPYSAGSGVSPTEVTTFSKIGTTAGLAVNQRSGDVFAAAYYKRSSGLEPAGAYSGLAYPTGAIYSVAPNTGAVSLFADVNAGPDAHPPLEANGGLELDWENDFNSWPLVGHEGWGAIATDPGGENLYAINLYNRSLYRFPLQGGTLNSTGQVEPASVTPISDPGCSNDDWAPSALGFDPLSGQLYIGGVCTAATSQTASDLHAYVDLVSNPAGTPSFTPMFNFGLGYNRIPNNSQAYPAGSGMTDTSTSDWQPWPTLNSVPNPPYTQGPPDSTRGMRSTPYGSVNVDDESYPLFAGLSFDSSGNMLIGLRDLMEDMNFPATPGQADNPAASQGDLLKACRNGSGGWTLESGGVCGGAQGFHPSVNGTPVPGSNYGVDDAVFGPIGPGGGYFFDPNRAIQQSDPDTATDRFWSPGPAQGGVLQVPGFDDVVSTQDLVDDSGLPGLVWNNDSNGNFSHAVDDGAGAQFAYGAPVKANDLGDLAAFASLAPVQIGNRVWKDQQSNCTEDAGDGGFGGVVVNLLGVTGADVATTTTNSAGEYTFDIQSGTAYKVAIQTSQKSLKGLVPTCANKQGVDSRITSKGVLSGGLDAAMVAPLGPGQDNFTYDFGFVTPTIGLVKKVSKHSVLPGDLVTYKLTVTNRSPATVSKVKVCDNMPADLALTRNRSGAKLVHGWLCFGTIKTLGAHRSKTFKLKFHALTPSTCGLVLKNKAYATATGARTVWSAAKVKIGCRAVLPAQVTG